MSRNNTNIYNDIPESLENHPFYGIELDEEQKVFRDSIWGKDNIVTICNAKAGSGKTTIALGVANLLVQYGLYNEIVYIVAPTMEQKQGFIPGDPDDKNAPYMQPLVDALITLNIEPGIAIKSNNNLRAIKEGKSYISFMSHTYLRGTNFENKVIIVDECQNFYADELKKVLTRMHDSNKILLIGHEGQCDLLKHKEKNGFRIYLDAFEKIKDDKRVAICELKTNHRGWFSNFCDDVEF